MDRFALFPLETVYIVNVIPLRFTLDRCDLISNVISDVIHDLPL